MLYLRIPPPESLSHLIDCYWVIENEDSSVIQQKIVPDGFPEIIFHYGDPYRINISGKWLPQSRQLLAGQIRNHFLLENTGRSGMIGIKFHPTAITKLFGIDMSGLTDNVIDLNEVPPLFEAVTDALLSSDSYTSKIDLLNDLMDQQLIAHSDNLALADRALELIFEHHGLIQIAELLSQLDVSERKLERVFARCVGLSPKFYSRVIRFNYLFQAVEENPRNWAELAQFAGFYDQSHFIRNFKEFTGEEPSRYFFDEENMANFFLKRSEEIV